MWVNASPPAGASGGRKSHAVAPDGARLTADRTRCPPARVDERDADGDEPDPQQDAIATGEEQGRVPVRLTQHPSRSTPRLRRAKIPEVGCSPDE